MTKLTAKKRRGLPKAEFALPKKRAYPLDTKGRQINAKARAKQMKDDGKLSTGKYDEVVRKANKKLYGKASLTVPKKKAKKNENEYEMKHEGRKVRVRHN